MNTPLVSVIIAVYNAEAYLSRCLDSVLSQTHCHLEVICVDDASTDASAEILEGYRQRDERVTVLRQSVNGGAHVARNRAMACSHGKYMTMVDADDAIAPDAIAQAVGIMERDGEVDYVMYDMIAVHPDGTEEGKFRNNPAIPERMTGWEACYWSMPWSIPGIGVSRSPLEQDMPAQTDIGQYADDNATHIVLYKSRFVVQSDARYYYYQNEESYVHHIGIRRFDILPCRHALRRQMLALGMEQCMIERLDRWRWADLIEMCFLYWRHASKLSVADRKKAYAMLREAYATFRFRDLPSSVALKPGYVMLPTFRLFYLQLSVIFRLKSFRPQH